MEKIVDDFLNQTLFDYTTEVPRTFGFNGNSYPLCPRQLMLSYIAPQKYFFSVPFNTRYNYHVGKAIAALAQETWAKQSLLWGDWKCSDPSCGVSFKSMILNRGVCIRCGQPCDYIEKRLTDIETDFEGLVDGVVFCAELKGYLVFNLRSRNKNVIASSDAPYAGDLFSISIHASILSQKFGLPIAGRVLLWIGKPKPKPFKFWFFDRIGDNLANSMFEVKRKLTKQIEKGDFLDVVGSCITPQDVESVNCPFGAICFSPDREALISNQLKEFFKHEPQNI